MYVTLEDLLYGIGYKNLPNCKNNQRIACKKENKPTQKTTGRIGIQDVLFSGPATVIFWTDGTKTVAKCEKDDAYDKEKGFLVAWAKKDGYKNMKLHEALDKYVFNPTNKEEDAEEEMTTEELLEDIYGLIRVLSTLGSLESLRKYSR